MRTPYTIAELDALMAACISFTDEHEAEFYTGNIGGRDNVSVDIDYVKRMMDWVSETDKGLLESLGFGQNNVSYFRLGRDARRIMTNGGFKKYLRNRAVREGVESARMWAPICVSLLALIVSILAWQVPRGNSNRIDALASQLGRLQSDQEKTTAMVTTIRANLDTISLRLPPTRPTSR